MTLTIVEQHFRRPTQTTILFLIDLHQLDESEKSGSREKKNMPLRVETKTNPPSLL
jgi:hypothetical protein